MAHFVQVLNKLDAGVPEKIELASRDGDNLIIVSYGDLKRYVFSYIIIPIHILGALNQHSVI